MGQLSGAVQETRRLEEWREEMSRKMLSLYCGKLHSLETAVQSLANEGMRELATAQRHAGRSVALEELDAVLASPDEAAAPEGEAQEAPMLRHLWGLAPAARPPASVLGRLAGSLQSPSWYGRRQRIAVLTRDDWLHCFGLAQGEPRKRPKDTSRAQGPPRLRSQLPACGLSGREAQGTARRCPHDAHDAHADARVHAHAHARAHALRTHVGTSECLACH